MEDVTGYTEVVGDASSRAGRGRGPKPKARRYPGSAKAEYRNGGVLPRPDRGQSVRESWPQSKRRLRLRERFAGGHVLLAVPQHAARVAACSEQNDGVVALGVILDAPDEPPLGPVLGVAVDDDDLASLLRVPWDAEVDRVELDALERRSIRPDDMWHRDANQVGSGADPLAAVIDEARDEVIVAIRFAHQARAAARYREWQDREDEQLAHAGMMAQRETRMMAGSELSACRWLTASPP
jgi:hypothetical protein